MIIVSLLLLLLPLASFASAAKVSTNDIENEFKKSLDYCNLMKFEDLLNKYQSRLGEVNWEVILGELEVQLIITELNSEWCHYIKYYISKLAMLKSFNVSSFNVTYYSQFAEYTLYNSYGYNSYGNNIEVSSPPPVLKHLLSRRKLSVNEAKQLLANEKVRNNLYFNFAILRQFKDSNFSSNFNETSSHDRPFYDLTVRYFNGSLVVGDYVTRAKSTSSFSACYDILSILKEMKKVETSKINVEREVAGETLCDNLVRLYLKGESEYISNIGAYIKNTRNVYEFHHILYQILQSRNWTRDELVSVGKVLETNWNWQFSLRDNFLTIFWMLPSSEWSQFDASKSLINSFSLWQQWKSLVSSNSPAEFYGQIIRNEVYGWNGYHRRFVIASLKGRPELLLYNETLSFLFYTFKYDENFYKEFREILLPLAVVRNELSLIPLFQNIMVFSDEIVTRGKLSDPTSRRIFAELVQHVPLQTLMDIFQRKINHGFVKENILSLSNRLLQLLPDEAKKINTYQEFLEYQKWVIAKRANGSTMTTPLFAGILLSIIFSFV